MSSLLGRFRSFRKDPTLTTTIFRTIPKTAYFTRVLQRTRRPQQTPGDSRNRHPCSYYRLARVEDTICRRKGLRGVWGNARVPFWIVRVPSQIIDNHGAFGAIII